MPYQWQNVADHAVTGGDWQNVADHTSGAPPDTTGFIPSLKAQINSAILGATAGATVAPIPAAAVAFGASDKASFPSADDEKAIADRFRAAHDSAADALKKGDYLGAARQAQDLFLGEGMKEPVDKIEDQIGSGNYSGAAGSAIGFLGQFALAHGLGKVLGAGSSAIARSIDADPVTAVNKALTFPPNADTGHLKGALEDIKASEHPAIPITGNKTLLQNIPLAKKANRDAFGAYMARAADDDVSGAPIAAATAGSIPSSMWIENPDLAHKIIGSAKGYGQLFNVADLEKLLIEKNGELDSFYNQAPGTQLAAVQSGAPKAVVKAQRDSIASLLYNALDPENSGAGPREIQRRYGAITELEDAANRRVNAIDREQSVSPAGKMLKISQSAGKAVKLDFEGAVDKLGGSDSLIRRAFANTEPGSPLPKP
jgi:hypothetical protein